MSTSRDVPCAIAGSDALRHCHLFLFIAKSGGCSTSHVQIPHSMTIDRKLLSREEALDSLRLKTRPPRSPWCAFTPVLPASLPVGARTTEGNVVMDVRLDGRDGWW